MSDTDIQIRRAIGRRIKDRRVYLKMTQHEVADALCKNRPGYTGVELGNINITAVELGLLAKILRVPADYFFGDFNPAPDEDDLLRTYRALNEDRRRIAASIMATLLADQQ